MSVLIDAAAILCGLVIMLRARSQNEILLGALAVVLASFLLAAHWKV